MNEGEIDCKLKKVNKEGTKWEKYKEGIVNELGLKGKNEYV